MFQSNKNKGQLVFAVDEYDSASVKCVRRSSSLWVSVDTNLAASINVEQTNSTSQLFGILDAGPQNTGGEIQGAFIRLHTQIKHTHTGFTSSCRERCPSSHETKTALLSKKHLAASTFYILCCQLNFNLRG